MNVNMNDYVVIKKYFTVVWYSPFHVAEEPANINDLFDLDQAPLIIEASVINNLS